MTDLPEKTEEIARKTWGMAQRAGMQIAALPKEQREPALVKAEQSLTKTYQEFGATGPQLEGFVKLQMQAIRHFVTEIEASGTPQGGNA
jgi:hypothetical protein